MPGQGRVLLFDGDVVAYRAAASVEETICWDGDNCFPIGSLSEAKARATDMMFRGSTLPG
jgi:hypothetical protein